MVKTATKTSQGLARAREVYQNRDQRIREVKGEGKTVFGYMCIYPVLEMLTAFDIVPYRIFGNMRQPITDADNYLSPLVCPFARSCLDLGVKGKYDFLDGTAWAHTCDPATRIQAIWKTIVKTGNPSYMETPSLTHQPQLERYKYNLIDFQSDLESLTGKRLTKTMLRKAVKLHNQQRALVRELYDLRKPDPPLISGVETLQVVKALQSLPIDEGNQLLKETIEEVKSRKTGGPKKKSARLLIWGPVIDDTAFIDLIESLDANVVMDDTCVGSRAYFPDVPVTDDPLEGLVYHYLVELKCPRTVREAVYGAFKKDYKLDMEDRFGYIGKYIKDWNVNGVILQAPIFCDSHSFELPEIRDYFDSIGVPSIYLQHDYSEASLAPLRTRAEGFLEVIAQKKA